MNTQSELNIIAVIEDMAGEDGIAGDTLLHELDVTSIEAVVKAIAAKVGVDADDIESLEEASAECETVADIMDLFEPYA